MLVVAKGLRYLRGIEDIVGLSKDFEFKANFREVDQLEARDFCMLVSFQHGF